MAGSQARVAARIEAFGTYVPEQRLTNQELADIFETWSAEKIFEKTGILERRVALPHETSLDMGVAAARDLLTSMPDAAAKIDFLIFCTQAPDYFLPSSACVMQERLNLPKSVGALDINLGCSGYVYALSLATGLIASAAARHVLIVTADTYSKFIHPLDRSVRTLFGDGATASLISAGDAGGPGLIGPFVFGTDGRGAKDLIVPAGAARQPRSPETAIETTDDFGNVRSADHLYMNGGAVMAFTLREVPRSWQALKQRAGVDDDAVDWVVLHQANRFMLDALRTKLGLPAEKVPYHFERIGNTVSSTIPFALADLHARGELAPGKRAALIGFGVGLSWAAGLIDF